MIGSEQNTGKRYFIGYGFLDFIPYEEYLEGLLFYTFEDYVDDYMIVSSMTGFHYTTSKELE